MGSGETAPTMVTPHKVIFERLGEGAAVLLDTPYGFQENASDISRRAVGYFASSVGRRVEVLSWRTPPPPGIERERALATLRGAAWVFAGPGSPTYALRQWWETPIPGLLEDKLRSRGVLLFASAAALTAGSHTVPVYEIYKAGFEPRWERGLDLVKKVTGLPAVIIPHYNNAEGGHHDTRYCYLGERRLRMLERELPDEAFIIGVDEHTACAFDLDAGTIEVMGNAVMSIRRQGATAVVPAGRTVTFDDVTAMAYGHSTSSPVDAAATEQAPSTAPTSAERTLPETSLRSEVERHEKIFDAAYEDRDVARCISAALDVEQTLADWSADTLTSDEGEFARGVLRRMIVRLGELAEAGARDPREIIGPYVETLLQLRERARAERDFATGDAIRDRLAAAGVEVRDTPGGVEWHLG